MRRRRSLETIHICMGLVLYGAAFILLSACSSHAYVFDYSSLSVMRSPAGSTADVHGCYPPDVMALRSLASSFSASEAWGWPTNYTGFHAAVGADDDREVVVDCCSWPGVTCSSTTATFMSNRSRRTVRVSGLDIRFAYNASFRGSLSTPVASSSLCSLSALSRFTLLYAENRLTGRIPLCIGTHLTNLQHLDLSENSLRGRIPISLFNLHSLQYLRLAHNKLSGSIPSFNMSSSPLHLRLLDLSHNFFSGPIPTFNAPHLQTLLLSQNRLSDSLQPLLRSSFPKLTELQLHLNYISGDLSHFTSSAFPSLQHLRLSNNLLTGHFPLSLCHLATLISLHINSNQLSGPLPSSCGQGFAELTVLDLSSNQMTGPFPANWSKHRAVDLSHNRFNGTLPRFSHVVNDIRLCHNEFSGPFPAWIGDALSLSGLDLSFNKFSGRIPPEWQRLTSLTELYLSGNSIFGPSTLRLFSEDPPLPLWLFELPDLIFLSLGSMGLRPPDLTVYCDTPALNRSIAFERLDLSYNNLSADILRCFNGGAGTRDLNLAGNPLELDLNAIALRLPRVDVRSLDLSSCGLKGYLTDAFFKQLSPSLGYLSLAHNFLSGEIRIQIPSRSSLAGLDLSHNAFTSVAPFSGRGPYRLVNQLKLSNNKIAQDLPSILQGFIFDIASFNNTFNSQLTSNVASLDLSNNQITGSIPHSLRQFTFLSSLKVDNNLLEGTLILSDELGAYCSNLGTLSLSNNNLEGLIPAGLGGLKELVYLNLSRNKFSGSIPPELANLILLQSIDLSFNKLQGSIPAGMADLKELVLFNVSYNAELEGLNVKGVDPDLINRPVPFSEADGARILERPW